MRRRHICAVLAATGSALPFNVHAQQAATSEKERSKPKLAIVATMEIAPGRMDEFLPLVLAHRARCLRDEPGTLGFECLRVRGNPNGLMLYELMSMTRHLTSIRMARRSSVFSRSRREWSSASLTSSCARQSMVQAKLYHYPCSPSIQDTTG